MTNGTPAAAAQSAGGAGVPVFCALREGPTVSEEARARPPVYLQLIALFLLAFLPVAWLVGRRTAPVPSPIPLLFDVADPPISLQAGRAGIAGGVPAVKLPGPRDRRGGYRLNFSPVEPGQDPRPPYRLRIEGPGGDSLWQGTWDDPGTMKAPVQIVVPAALLEHGRHALILEDAAGIVRTYPFLVP
jgi:hypothetical protein